MSISKDQLPVVDDTVIGVLEEGEFATINFASGKSICVPLWRESSNEEASDQVSAQDQQLEVTVSEAAPAFRELKQPRKISFDCAGPVVDMSLQTFYGQDNTAPVLSILELRSKHAQLVNTNLVADALMANPMLAFQMTQILRVNGRYFVEVADAATRQAVGNLHVHFENNCYQKYAED